MSGEWVAAIGWLAALALATFAARPVGHWLARRDSERGLGREHAGDVETGETVEAEPGHEEAYQEAWQSLAGELTLMVPTEEGRLDQGHSHEGPYEAAVKRLHGFSLHEVPDLSAWFRVERHGDLPGVDQPHLFEARAPRGPDKDLMVLLSFADDSDSVRRVAERLGMSEDDVRRSAQSVLRRVPSAATLVVDPEAGGGR